MGHDTAWDRIAHQRIDFVIGGARKGGTSALYQYLRLHPQISMAAQKELHFFDNDATFSRGRVDRSRYHAGMKWILLLRSPLERAYSHWNMEREREIEALPFGRALRQERARCRAGRPAQHRLYSYADRGFYSEQIRRIWHFFPERQVLILRNEDLRFRPQATLNEICRFLGVAPLAIDAPRTVHSRVYHDPMNEADRAYLARLFEPEFRALEVMLGWNLDDWLEAAVPRGADPLETAQKS